MFQRQLCRPSMGYSFAAGATDGPGVPPFFQGFFHTNYSRID